MQYPFFEKIKALLAPKEQSVDWLGSQLGKSRRWVYDNKDITGISIEQVLKISALLDFDFMADWNRWLIENNQPALLELHEPEMIYKSKEQLITVNLQLRGEANSVAKHFGTMIKTIQSEGDKYGIKIQ